MRLGTLVGVGAIWTIICVMFFVAMVWVAGSALTSGVKVGTDQCGQTYPLEAVFSGDWFCAEDKTD
jgi:hypothetical protein